MWEKKNRLRTVRSARVWFYTARGKNGGKWCAGRRLWEKSGGHHGFLPVGGRSPPLVTKNARQKLQKTGPLLLYLPRGWGANDAPLSAARYRAHRLGINHFLLKRGMSAKKGLDSSGYFFIFCDNGRKTHPSTLGLSSQVHS